MRTLAGRGLGAKVAAELEKWFTEGRLRPGQLLPSERLLAERLGVGRGAVREALLRLASQGLIDIRHGRRARLVDWGARPALEGAGTLARAKEEPVRRAVLEGYLELERSTLVQSLVRCCQRAPPREMEAVEAACLRLEDCSRWAETTPELMQAELELLHAAAQASAAKGLMLLATSLCRTGAELREVLGNSYSREATLQWARLVLDCIWSRDTVRLQRELTALLEARDEALLARLCPHGSSSRGTA